jgi:hypothetical protein
VLGQALPAGPSSCGGVASHPIQVSPRLVLSQIPHKVLASTSGFRCSFHGAVTSDGLTFA